MVEERATLNELWDKEGYGHLECRKSQNLRDQASRLKKLQERDVDNKHMDILYGEQNGLVEIEITCDQESQNTNLTAPFAGFACSSSAIPIVKPNLRCFDTGFRRPYRCFSIVLKVIFVLVRSLQTFHQWLTMNWSLSKCSVRYSGAVLWNSLLETLRQAESLRNFKSLLHSYYNIK